MKNVSILRELFRHYPWINCLDVDALPSNTPMGNLGLKACKIMERIRHIVSLQEQLNNMYEDSKNIDPNNHNFLLEEPLAKLCSFMNMRNPFPFIMGAFVKSCS